MNWKDELKKKVIDGNIFMQDKGGQKRRCFDLISYEDAVDFIESLLKRQREICADKIPIKLGKSVMLWSKMDLQGISNDVASLYEDILNAPEPE